jgi:branched-chain amino acid transport system permease protein
MNAFGWTPPGAKQVFYGICLLIVVLALPEGVWPPLSRKLGLDKTSDKPEA